jgi:hypothetical protein
MNHFSSSFFAWVDIGYLREKEDSRFKGKQLIKRLPHLITENQVNVVAVVFVDAILGLIHTPTRTFSPLSLSLTHTHTHTHAHALARW